ncbi:hypothetical protein SAMN04489724_3675, partial [Algoriphagus locisalis]
YLAHSIGGAVLSLNVWLHLYPVFLIQFKDMSIKPLDFDVIANDGGVKQSLIIKQIASSLVPHFSQ